jgi:hypothetical protein
VPHRRLTLTYMQAYFLAPSNFDEWRHVRHRVVGQASVAGGEPLLSLGIIANGMPTWRIDLHRGLGYSCFQDVRCVGSSVYIGFGQHVIVFDSKHERVSLHPLDGYFGHLYVAADLDTSESTFGLLAVSASELLRFDDQGQLQWRRSGLGIDGLLVDSVEQGMILGRGEWDPPGGWRPYRVRLDSGES